MTTKQPPAQRHLDISDEELLKRNKKYVDANKSSKNTFDDLDFAYYHGQLDLLEELNLTHESAPTSEGFEDAYNKFRSEHVNASFMPKDMAKAMFLAGQASRNIRLPEKRSATPRDDADNRGFNECIEYITRLNAGAAFKIEGE